MTQVINKVYPGIVLSQGEYATVDGQPSVVIEHCLDKESSDIFKKRIEDKIRDFGVAIQNKHGYYVVLRKQQTLDGITIYYVDVKEAKLSYVFLLNDIIVEYQIHREVV